ncbi:gastrula zinc finger protein XlCGF57.1-like [Chaetodon trifascialis]|uniref:gastrula zinc finger protein XlCGF57.1-like n=1 Tax=Chaetodon trifascialis TaxID=109706 RepID=UPI0039964468
MSKIQTLRAFVNQRLTAAAEEIFERFERTIAEYEEQLCRQRKLLEANLNPDVRLHRADIELLLLASDKEVPTEQQEWSPSLDQEDPPELPHIKEEQEELWTSQEGQQHQGLEEADIGKFTFTAVPVKSEEDDEEAPQSSQLHRSQAEESRDAENLKREAGGEDCGGSERARNFNPHGHLQPATHDKTSHCEPDTDDSCDWEESGEYNARETSVSSSECTTSSGHKGHLQKHAGIQTGVKPFGCSVCGKRYPRKSALRTHIRLHIEGKRFSCSICEKTFQSKGNLVRHMRIHTGEKPFICPVCDSRFSHSSAFTSHLRVHTGEKPFTCLVCKTSFGDRSSLARHRRIHTGEKSYSCLVCGRKFARHGTLTQHLVVHTGEKPFNCSVCGKNFTRHALVKKHKCVGQSSVSK